ncbi:hypothetical protein [Winogradskyella sp. A3E31]|uniref:hypothetical protein n=1 Tax=Winogradskyella sp. A3E31 TaxID=3349637 RepID=UPI00398A8D2C
MTTITKHIVALILCLSVAGLCAQEKQKDTLKSKSFFKQQQIESLEEAKERITGQEKDFLKAEVEAINIRLDNGEITAAEAEDLKKEAAQKRALNIEDRLAIIDTKIELIKRNPYKENLEDYDNGRLEIGLGTGGVVFDLRPNRKPPKYDIRTSNDLLFAIGFNNTIIDGQSLSDSPYKLGGSGFVELGWIWNTRVFEKSNFLRFRYGFSFQWNKLDIKDDQYFVQNDEVTTLEDFPGDIKNAQFRVTNLVVPIHFEFGPSKKRDYKDRLRYTTDGQFKVGLGGYGGVRIGTQQKLRYEENGDRVKQKTRRNYNASTFVYGLSGYIGVGDWSLYAKYDLNELFDDQVIKQNNISLGIRLDLD